MLPHKRLRGVLRDTARADRFIEGQRQRERTRHG
jgi:hypothetical protein